MSTQGANSLQKSTSGTYLVRPSSQQALMATQEVHLLEHKVLLCEILGSLTAFYCLVHSMQRADQHRGRTARHDINAQADF